MAKETDVKEPQPEGLDRTESAFSGQQKTENSPPQERTKKTLLSKLMPWIIMAVAILICAAVGFGLGKVFGSLGSNEAETQSDEINSAQDQLLKSNDSESDSQKTWYYDLEPVVANLNEPGVTRYVRATLILAISNEIDQNKAILFLEEKKPLLKNWLTLYLANQTVEDIRGEKNLRRIQSQILDAVNEKLFPDAKPQVKHILFKEFAIQ